MIGIDSTTGKHLGDLDHLRQSVRDILMTPIGSRVMRREYGSQIFQMIDKPLNRSGLMDLYAATADALERWEPRLQVLKVAASMTNPGQLLLDITARHLASGRTVVLDGIEVAR